MIIGNLSILIAGLIGDFHRIDCFNSVGNSFCTLIFGFPENQFTRAIKRTLAAHTRVSAGLQ